MGTSYACVQEEPQSPLLRTNNPSTLSEDGYIRYRNSDVAHVVENMRESYIPKCSRKKNCNYGNSNNRKVIYKAKLKGIAQRFISLIFIFIIKNYK